MTGVNHSLEMTALELSVALALLASKGQGPEPLARILSRYYERHVSQTMVTTALEGMAQRGWVCAGRRRDLILTRSGEEATRMIFEALVRQIDGGCGLWQAGLMWTLTGRGGPDEPCH